MEPAYSFTIPSLYDDTPLECRIYHPKRLEARLVPATQDLNSLCGAVVGHPYAPLGGSFDDGVVLAVAQCLVKQGFVVGTFNFRCVSMYELICEISMLTLSSGASGSKGSTSWTGRPEKDDYMAFAGFMIYYLHYLGLSVDDTIGQKTSRPFDLLLAGYSYASLIVSKLPPMETIVQRFEAAERGTAAAEIMMRAQRLARETRESAETQRTSTDVRGRQSAMAESTSPTSPRTRPSPVVVGGEETDASERRRSRDTRRSASVVREVPRRIKAHIRHHSDGHRSSKAEIAAPVHTNTQAASPVQSTPPKVSVSYLLVSPVLPPLSHTLVSPSSVSALLSTSKGAFDKDTGVGALQYPSMIVFGSTDGFTSAKRLKVLCTKLESQASGNLHWAEIDGAGHFWREDNAMRQLTHRVSGWVKAMRRET